MFPVIRFSSRPVKKVLGFGGIVTLLLIGVAVAVKNIDAVPEGTGDGWCCMQGGSTCTGNQNPVSCSRHSGVIYAQVSRDCDLACLTFPVN